VRGGGLAAVLECGGKRHPARRRLLSIFQKFTLAPVMALW